MGLSSSSTSAIWSTCARPAMYIGDTGKRGLHHLIFEVVDNSIDEAMAGYAREIQVIINSDGSVTVEDDGRGIPVEVHPDLGVSTLQGVMTVLKFGGKFTKGAYVTAGGLHGVGVTVVNFLSEWCSVEVRRGGHVYQQEYERGEPTSEVRRIGTTTKVGTKTTFKPDPQIFGDVRFQYGEVYRRLQELAFLNPGVKIIFRDERTGDGEIFCYRDGIREFVRHLNRGTQPLHADIIYIAGEYEIPGVEGEFNRLGLEVASQYTEDYTENVHSFVNNINTVEGGHAPFRLSGGPDPNAERLRQEGRLIQGVGSHRRGFPRRADRDPRSARPLPPIRGSDQDQTGQQRGRGHCAVGRVRAAWALSGGESQDGTGHSGQSPPCR